MGDGDDMVSTLPPSPSRRVVIAVELMYRSRGTVAPLSTEAWWLVADK